MAMTKPIKTIFFVFFLFLLSSSSSAKHSNNKPRTNINDNDNNVVRITNLIPRNSSNPSSVNVRCSFKKTDLGQKTLESGEEYQWKVEEKALHYCEALRGTLMASWHGFQPKRDFGHSSVFWVIRENGFFLSWDNSTWVRKSIWETE